MGKNSGGGGIPYRIHNPEGLHQRYRITKIIGTEALMPTEHGRQWVSVADMLEVPIGAILRPIFEPVDDEAEYFVLRLDEGGKDPNHVAACRLAVHKYADAIEPFIPKLARDLRERYPLIK